MDSRRLRSAFPPAPIFPKSSISGAKKSCQRCARVATVTPFDSCDSLGRKHCNEQSIAIERNNKSLNDTRDHGPFGALLDSSFQLIWLASITGLLLSR